MNGVKESSEGLFKISDKLRDVEGGGRRGGVVGRRKELRDVDPLLKFSSIPLSGETRWEVGLGDGMQHCVEVDELWSDWRLCWSDGNLGEGGELGVGEI